MIIVWKYIVGYLTKWEKFYLTNYDICHRKVNYFLIEIGVLEILQIL